MARIIYTHGIKHRRHGRKRFKTPPSRVSERVALSTYVVVLLFIFGIPPVLAILARFYAP